VQAEALTRNLEGFARFLGVAALSQAAPLSIAGVAADVGLSRKTVEGWFDLVVDLLIGVRLPVFTRRARRAMTARPKFFYFDAGVYRAIRPRGPLDSSDEIDGPAVETLVLQELRATNDNLGLGYAISTWRTRQHVEVDFVLYGERGFQLLLYGGDRPYELDGIRVEPLADALPRLATILGGTG
jgi:predicted AAA+ superfamily ATPase